MASKCTHFNGSCIKNKYNKCIPLCGFHFCSFHGNLILKNQEIMFILNDDRTVYTLNNNHFVDKPIVFALDRLNIKINENSFINDVFHKNTILTNIENDDIKRLYEKNRNEGYFKTEIDEGEDPVHNKSLVFYPRELI
jgi:hypothetical protein